ncbi:membrane protein [Streptomyces phage Phredrick]|nr:membrane protein [Streptomyces phage Phredrick]
MIFLWIYLAGLTVCLLGGTVTAFVEKRRFQEDKVSATVWGSIILLSLWWPVIPGMNILFAPLAWFDKNK